MIHIEYVKTYEHGSNGRVKKISRYAIITGDSPQELIAFGISRGLTEAKIRQNLKFGPVPQFTISGKALRELQADSTLENNMGRVNSRGFRGVTQMDSSSWQSNIWLPDKKVMKYLGRFKTAEEAARAYDKAAKEYWGKSAILNFPEENFPEMSENG